MVILQQELKPIGNEIKVIIVLDRSKFSMSDPITGKVSPFTLDWEM